MELLDKCKRKNNSFYDVNSTHFELNVNDQVYLENEPYDKFKNIYAGPFIVKAISYPNVEIFDTNTNKSKTIHMNRLRK